MNEEQSLQPQTCLGFHVLRRSRDFRHVQVFRPGTFISLPAAGLQTPPSASAAAAAALLLTLSHPAVVPPQPDGKRFARRTPLSPTPRTRERRSAKRTSEIQNRAGFVFHRRAFIKPERGRLFKMKIFLSTYLKKIPSRVGKARSYRGLDGWQENNQWKRSQEEVKNLHCHWTESDEIFFAAPCCLNTLEK